MVRSLTDTETDVWVVPEKPPTKRPRKVLPPESVLLLPTMVALLLIVGRSPLVSVIVPTPLLMMMLLEPPAALELMIAWRNEPAPLSALLVTVKSAAQSGQGERQVPSSKLVVKRRNVADDRWSISLPQHRGEPTQSTRLEDGDSTLPIPAPMAC
jgi:hypothetical protein